MCYERKTKFGEGMIFAAVLLICIAVIAVSAAVNRPQAERVYAIHALPESFVSLDKININLASAEELDELPGVGETLAGRIVAYREENGRFESIDDIVLVDGIGEGIFADIKDMITTGE